MRQLILLLAVALGVHPGPDCKPQLTLHTTYAQAKAACPDIGRQAVDTSGHYIAIYLCPSQHVLVFGDRVTHEVVGLLDQYVETRGHEYDSISGRKPK